MMGNWVISMYIIFKIYIYCRLVGMFSKQSSSTHSTAIKAIYLLQALPQSCHKAITKESQLVSHRLDNQLLTLYLVYMCWCFKQKKKKKDGVEVLGMLWDCCYSLGHFGAGGMGSGFILPERARTLPELP